MVATALASTTSPALAGSPFIANTFTQSIVDQATVENTVSPPTKEDLLDLSSTIALKNGIKSATLVNLVGSESTWNPNAVGDHSCSYGLVQINICAHKEVSKEEALDPTFALNYAAEAISEGTEDAWSACNCYSYIQANYIKNLPRMAEITVNTNVPHKGEVAIFWYPDRSHPGKLIKHISYVLDERGTLSEANKTHCLVGTRLIPTNDPYLAGYWDSKVQ